MDDMARGSVAVGLAWMVVLAAGAVSLLHATFMLSSVELDRASPIPGYQRWISIAGVVAVAGLLALIHREESITGIGGWYGAIVLLLAVTCALPLWHHRSTVDVTTAGFHRAAYEGYWYDLHVYNGTDAPVVVSIGADTRFPARLRAPGRTVGPHDRVALTWPRELYGTFTLAITSPLPPGARLSASVARKRAPERVTV